MKREDTISILVDGVTATTGVASVAIAIPNAANGMKPRYIRIAATTESYVAMALSTVAATINSMLVQPADSVILAVGGATHVAYIQGTTSGKVNITPLEDQ